MYWIICPLAECQTALARVWLIKVLYIKNPGLFSGLASSPQCLVARWISLGNEWHSCPPSHTHTHSCGYPSCTVWCGLGRCWAERVVRVSGIDSSRRKKGDFCFPFLSLCAWDLSLDGEGGVFFFQGWGWKAVPDLQEDPPWERLYGLHAPRAKSGKWKYRQCGKTLSKQTIFLTELSLALSVSHSVC